MFNSTRYLILAAIIAGFFGVVAGSLISSHTGLLVMIVGGMGSTASVLLFLSLATFQGMSGNCLLTQQQQGVCLASVLGILVLLVPFVSTVGVTSVFMN